MAVSPVHIMSPQTLSTALGLLGFSSGAAGLYLPVIDNSGRLAVTKDGKRDLPFGAAYGEKLFEDLDRCTIQRKKDVIFGEGLIECETLSRARLGLKESVFDGRSFGRLRAPGRFASRGLRYFVYEEPRTLLNSNPIWRRGFEMAYVLRKLNTPATKRAEELSAPIFGIRQFTGVTTDCLNNHRGENAQSLPPDVVDYIGAIAVAGGMEFWRRAAEVGTGNWTTISPEAYAGPQRRAWKTISDLLRIDTLTEDAAGKLVVNILHLFDDAPSTYLAYTPSRFGDVSYPVRDISRPPDIIPDHAMPDKRLARLGSPTDALSPAVRMIRAGGFSGVLEHETIVEEMIEIVYTMPLTWGRDVPFPPPVEIIMKAAAEMTENRFPVR